MAPSSGQLGMALSQTRQRWHRSELPGGEGPLLQGAAGQGRCTDAGSQRSVGGRCGFRPGPVQLQGTQTLEPLLGGGQPRRMSPDSSTTHRAAPVGAIWPAGIFFGRGGGPRCRNRPASRLGDRLVHRLAGNGMVRRCVHRMPRATFSLARPQLGRCQKCRPADQTFGRSEWRIETTLTRPGRLLVAGAGCLLARSAAALVCCCSAARRTASPRHPEQMARRSLEGFFLPGGWRWANGRPTILGLRRLV